MQSVENSTGQMTQVLQQIDNKRKKERELLVGRELYYLYLYIYIYIYIERERESTLIHFLTEKESGKFNHRLATR